MRLIQVYDRKHYTNLYKHVKEKSFTCGIMRTKFMGIGNSTVIDNDLKRLMKVSMGLKSF